MELDDFLDVREVAGWQPSNLKQDILAFGFMVLAVAVVGAILYAVI